MNIIEKELQKVDIKQLKNRKILLMGRIEHVRQIKNWLYGQEISVKAVLDNDKKKQGLHMDGIPISAPEAILCPYQKDIFIFIYSPKYWEDMCGQLLEYGYQEKEQIYVLDRPELDKNIELVRSGIHIYEELQKQYGENVQVFLANCPLGDYYLLGLYFHQYCKENRIDNYVIVGESKGIEKLSAAFQMEPAHRITTEESNALIRAWIFLGENVIHMKPLTLWQGAFRFNPCQTRQKGRFSFMETFTKMIYHIDAPVPQYPDMPGDRELVKTFFEQGGLKYQKTVILSPFSYSLQTLPAQFWIDLAEMLKKSGYFVAVNVGDEREHNFITDTATLCMDFFNTMSAMEYAGVVIGIRSGFFDITAQAKCKRVVLYPPSTGGQTSWNSTNMDFCSLKRMGLCEDAYEWEVVDIEEIYKKIMDLLQIEKAIE